MRGGKRLQVLQLISSLEVGGAEKLLLDFLAASRSDDRASFVVVVMNEHVDPGMREALMRLGLPVYFLNRPQGHWHPRYLLALSKIIRRHRIDIVHAHNYGSKMWSALARLLHPRLKLVYTIHDTHIVSRMKPWQRALLRYGMDVNVAISQSVEAECRQHGIGNCRQVYNGIDILRFANPNKPMLADRVQRRSFDEEPLRILNVARMDYRKKGQDLLVAAVKRCRENGLNVRCQLMGGVYFYNEAVFADLQRMVTEPHLENEIEFVVNRTDVPAYLARADVFVLPSRFEGLGLVVLEAMAAGVPVIAANIDGPRELIEDGVNGYLFEAGNAEDLFKKIRMVYRMPAVADKLRQNALAYVQRFDISVMTAQYLDLYESLTGKAPQTETRLDQANWREARP